MTDPPALCPACEGAGSLPDGSECPKCRAPGRSQAMLLEGEADGLMDRLLASALVPLEGAGRWLATSALGAATGLAAAGCLGAAVYASWVCVLELFDILEFSRGIGAVGLVPLLVLSGTWLMTTAARVGIPAAIAWWLVRRGRSVQDADPASRWAPLHVDDSRVEVRELHGRPGVAAFVSLRPDEIPDDGRLDLHLRLLDAGGVPVRALVPSFADPSGALRVRVALGSGKAPRGAQVERGAFVPLAALDLPEDPGPRPLVAWLLVFSDGWLRAEVRLPVTIPARPAAGAEEDDPPGEAGIDLMATRILAQEARCGVCGDGLGTDPAEAVVACSRCEAPHHEECWRFAGQCSTYACAGEATRGKADGAAPAAPAPLPVPLRAVPGSAADPGDDRLGSWSPPAAAPAVGWRIACPGCEAIATLDASGRCPACRTSLAAALPLARVPPRPRPWFERPWAALPLALGEILGPFLAAVAVSQALGADVALLAVGLAGLALGWRGMLAPLASGLARLGRVRPVGELRNFSPRLRIRAARVTRPESGAADPAVLGLTLLARPDPRSNPRLAVRIRGPGGHYLQALDGPLQGDWMEYRARARLLPAKGDGPALGDLELPLPLDCLRLPPGDAGNPLTAELVLADDSGVLAEAELELGATRPGAAAVAASLPAAGLPAARIEWRAGVAADPGPAACALCREPLGRVGERCTGCQRLYDLECLEFFAACPGCRGESWRTEALGALVDGSARHPRKRSGLG